MMRVIFCLFEKKRSLFWVFFLSLLLSGCVQPLSIDKRIDLPPDYLSGFDAEEFDGVVIDDEQLVQWWEQFQDPVLTELIEHAVSNNTNIAITLTRIEQARAAERGSRAALLPQVGASAGSQRFSGAGSNAVINSWQADLQVGWEVDLFGAGRERLSAAQYQTQANIADMYAVRLSLVATVANLYFDYRGMQQQYQLLLDSLQHANEFLDITQTRFRHGFANQADMHMAQADVARVQFQLKQTDMQIELLRLGLENLCMLQPGSLVPLLSSPAALPDIPPTITDGQPIDLLLRRPDLLAAQSRLRWALSQSEAARRDYFPRLTLSGLFGFAGAGGNIGQNGDSLWLSGLSAVVPFFDFGLRSSQVQLWDARSQEALLAYQKIAVDALFDVERALLQLTRNRDLQATLSIQEQEREKIVQQVYRQFELGTVGRLDLVEARVSLLDTQMSLLAQHVLRLQTQVDLFRALGGGWDINQPRIINE